MPTPAQIERQATREREQAEKAARAAARREKREREQAEQQARAEVRAQRWQARLAAQAEQQARAEVRAQRRQARLAAQAEQQARAATRRAERSTTAPARKRKRKDSTSRAFGTDPNRVYEFRYRVVDLDTLITSNTDAGSINPAYNQELQPRMRDRVASRRQVEQVARNLVPESLLWDFHQLDKGAPIIGSDHMVESGNGRMLALRRARVDFPEQWDNYQNKLRENLKAVGLDDRDLAGISNPVLVRERLSDVNRVEFAREANAPPVLQMSTLETAMVDSKRISDSLVLRLIVKEDQSIDMALRAAANRNFVRDFMQTLSENEAAILMRKDGTLNQAGIWRIKAAVFTKVFPGEAGQRLAETFLESLDTQQRILKMLLVQHCQH